MTKEQIARTLAQTYTVDGDYYVRGRVKVHLFEDCLTIKQGDRLDIVYYDDEDMPRVLGLLVD